ncbi:NAD(P)-dependent oxidoreductase [Geomicrobium sediminis]|uniref:NADH-flavin reductase n=1 Tax=Geomicrobium sediminis TaxID=1347788 RepID=A0ABS2P6X8_9BACL|nr:NAD(P)-dependent oxidoreductase [Geomicrobium sediminis]MBM7631158.1 putative NADH-flavin reductase [Geomicrobium sediminis]
MKVAIIGASGKAGRLIMKEALKRGHEIMAVVRDRSKVKENVVILEKDVFELTSNDLEPFDVVVSAYGAAFGEEDKYVQVGKALVEALAGTTARFIVVGGAGSLYVDEQKTTQLMETAEFPEFALATAKGQNENLDVLQNTTNVTWTFISPAAFFDPDGKKTGAYEKGGDILIVNSTGESYISYEDYAIAVVDEIEQEKHVNERFAVVGEKA